MSEQIQVAATAPAFPLILADSAFLATLAKVEEQAAALKITDAQSAQQAADLQSRLTTAGKKLEAARTTLKQPFLDIGRKIDETAREPAARIERAKGVLKSALTAYDAEQQQIAREAELTRSRELERLEKIRLAEEAAAQAKADELARMAAEAVARCKTPVVELDFDEGPVEPPPKTATELQIEAVKFAPSVAVQRPMGLAFKTRLVHRVESVAALPEPFVIRSANDKAIRATFCDGYKECEPLPVCAGVVFTVERTAVNTGRNTF